MTAGGRLSEGISEEKWHKAGRGAGGAGAGHLGGGGHGLRPRRFLTNAVGAVREPVRKAGGLRVRVADGALRYFGEYEELLAENERLRAELAEARDQAQAYSDQAAENRRLRQALGLEQRGADYTLESAKIVTWSASNWGSSFTLSKGARTA